LLTLWNCFPAVCGLLSGGTWVLEDFLISIHSSLSHGRLLLGRVWKPWDLQVEFMFALGLPVQNLVQCCFPHSSTHSWEIPQPGWLSPLGIQMGKSKEWLGTCLAHRLLLAPSTKRRESSKLNANNISVAGQAQPTCSTNTCGGDKEGLHRFQLQIIQSSLAW
jgi:hypothetical protein